MANIYKSKFTGEQIDQMLEDASKAVNIEVNPSGEATEELTKITIGDKTYSIPEGTVVEGNPSGEATEELTKLTIGETTYSIPEGTAVEGNPSGDSTVELTKLKIGDTIYSIPQGGGGGTTLYKHSLKINGQGYSSMYVVNTSPNKITDESTPRLYLASAGFLLVHVYDYYTGILTSQLPDRHVDPENEIVIRVLYCSQGTTLTALTINTINDDVVTQF